MFVKYIFKCIFASTNKQKKAKMGLLINIIWKKSVYEVRINDRKDKEFTIEDIKRFVYDLKCEILEEEREKLFDTLKPSNWVHQQESKIESKLETTKASIKKSNGESLVIEDTKGFF
jgi:hypothetical protein